MYVRLMSMFMPVSMSMRVALFICHLQVEGPQVLFAQCMELQNKRVLCALRHGLGKIDKAVYDVTFHDCTLACIAERQSR